MQMPLWATLVQRCTAADPAARPTFSELAAELELELGYSACERQLGALCL
jgi:hypothetical protein